MLILSIIQWNIFESKHNNGLKLSVVRKYKMNNKTYTIYTTM